MPDANVEEIEEIEGLVRELQALGDRHVESIGASAVRIGELRRKIQFQMLVAIAIAATASLVATAASFLAHPQNTRAGESVEKSAEQPKE